MYKMLLFCFFVIVSVSNASVCPDYDRAMFSWGFDNDSLNIEVGQVITDVSIWTDGYCSVFIIDNPDEGFRYYDKIEENLDYDDFAYGRGVSNGCLSPNEISYLSVVNDPADDVWGVFDTPPIIAGQEYSSSLLKFLDYAGTGKSCGFMLFGNFRRAVSKVFVSDLQTGELVSIRTFSMEPWSSLFENWLTEEEYNADSTGDKFVNLSDFSVLAKHYLPIGGVNLEVKPHFPLDKLAELISRKWMSKNEISHYNSRKPLKE